MSALNVASRSFISSGTITRDLVVNSPSVILASSRWPATGQQFENQDGQRAVDVACLVVVAS